MTEFVIEAEGMEYEADESTVGDKLKALSSLGHLDDGVVVRSGGTPTPTSVEREEPDFSKGDVAIDPESNADWGGQDVEIVEVLDETAKEHNIVIDGRKTTVAAENPGHPEDATVVLASYESGSRPYAFPATRLEPVE